MSSFRFTLTVSPRGSERDGDVALLRDLRDNTEVLLVEVRIPDTEPVAESDENDIAADAGFFEEPFRELNASAAVPREVCGAAENGHHGFVFGRIHFVLLAQRVEGVVERAQTDAFERGLIDIGIADESGLPVLTEGLPEGGGHEHATFGVDSVLECTEEERLHFQRPPAVFSCLSLCLGFLGLGCRIGAWRMPVAKGGGGPSGSPGAGPMSWRRKPRSGRTWVSVVFIGN